MFTELVGVTQACDLHMSKECFVQPGQLALEESVSLGGFTVRVHSPPPPNQGRHTPSLTREDKERED